MPIRLPYIALGVALVSTPPALAEDSVLSPEWSKCIDKTSGVTADMLDCDGAELKRQDKRLNAVYSKLMKLGTDEQKKLLRESQRAWLAYRANTCNLMYTFGGGGSLDTIAASGCETEVLARRVRFLESLGAKPE